MSVKMITMLSLFVDFENAIKPFVNKVYSDALGNIIAHRAGEGKRIMLVAHHDVVRLMITHIDDSGYLYIKPSGGIDASILPSRKVIIKHEGKDLLGIIGKKPYHLHREDQNIKISFDGLWIDIGAKSMEEARLMVEKGDYAYFCAEYEEMPNGLITGAYLDNHVGLEVLQKLAERLSNITLPWEVYLVASNHEEIGMRGALVAANSIQPDVCICIDVTHATDYPTMNVLNDGDIKLGKGCVIAKGPNIYPELFSILEDMAKCNGIKYQVEVSPYPTGTDASIIQITGTGVKTAVVSIPCRYMHTPHEVCTKTDIKSAIDLLSAFLQSDINLV